MLQSDRAIALLGIRYGDSSLIVHLYSQKHGRLTMMVNGAYPSGKRPGKAVLFQPLSLLNILYYPSKHGGMARFKEASPYINFKSLPFNHAKRAIALFMSEVVYRTIREEEPNASLYQFLESSIEYLDLIDTGIANFHLSFLTQLSRHIGFYPNGEFSEANRFFNLKTGHFESHEPLHPQFLSPENGYILSVLLKKGYNELGSVALSGKQRTSYLKGMVDYYSYHLGGMGPINSLQVLYDVFET